MTAHHGQINMTPLIDILLVLLIIFMVITPTQSMGLDANVPRPDTTTAAVNLRTIVVELDSALNIRINSEPSTVETLAGRLKDIFGTRAERALFVKAAPDTEFRHVAAIMDIAKGVGVDQIGLLR